MLTISQAEDIQAAAQPRFKVTQHRKPWNAAAAWVLLQAEFLAAEADTARIDTVAEFARRLKATLEFKAERDSSIRRGAKSVEIRTWKALGDAIICGVDKPNSTSGAAFTISLADQQ